MTKPIRKPAQETTCWSCSMIQAPTLGSIEVSPEIIESINFFSHGRSLLLEASTGRVFVIVRTGSIGGEALSGAISTAVTARAGKIFFHGDEGEVNSATLTWICRE